MDIIIERKNGIAEVKFNRPEVRNALTFEMYEVVYNLCVEANETEEIRAIIFCGGRFLCVRVRDRH
jgi:enoyl-CoA hydratase